MLLSYNAYTIHNADYADIMRNIWRKKGCNFDFNCIRAMFRLIEGIFQLHCGFKRQ